MNSEERAAAYDLRRGPELLAPTSTYHRVSNAPKTAPEAMNGRAGMRSDGALAVAVAGIVALLVFPVPPALLDVLLTAQLGAAVAVLVAAVSARRPQALTVLPSVILLAALLRLGLNVSTTRLILSRGDAGTVVAAFGDAVVAGDLLSGAV